MDDDWMDEPQDPLNPLHPISGPNGHGGAVASVTLDIKRGQSRSVEFTLHLAEGQSGDPHVLTIPGAGGTGLTTIGKSSWG